MRAATFLVIACALAVGALGGDNMKSKHMEVVKKCMTEIGLDESGMKDVFKVEGEPDQKIKCFHACMAKEFGTMVDGKIDKDKVNELVPTDVPNRDQAMEVLGKCAEEKGSDDCETAYLVFKCLVDNKVFPPPPPHPE